MYNLEKVKELEAKSNAALATMGNIVNNLTARIDAYQADNSRSDAFKKEQIQRARDEAMPAFSEQNEIVTAISKEIYGQKEFYESKMLMLSQETFVDDPAKDAAIRANLGRELAAVPMELLRLAIKSAQADENLPYIYQGFLAATARNDEFRQAGGFEIGLDSVELPEQNLGLAAINKGLYNVKQAEFLLIDMVGARVSPYKRLNMINERDATRVGA